MLETIIPPGGQEPPANSTRDSSRTADGSDISTAKEWFKAVLKIQHSAITQAQDDVELLFGMNRAGEGKMLQWAASLVNWVE
ncbi:hypothetical protein PGT21_022878 [Puccinia graminis f. sp. tritici]|nr:hypothetical protein PGT21_022366 [Puccinia graminis f. sp. tritici]KAA1093052.1 hypothetical protein PGT21_022878 [Puccinia graminis f. sp. tritici]KAA1097039.1 hypothetical protein PGTUg99_002329 [Puccinia graminis f. sp. tritici]KAA1115620.1 hypothetical protein PGTUg99_014023 [Puccinia graminis f. sp. tritici]